MHTTLLSRRSVLLPLAAAVAAFAFIAVASADHSWGPYHWRRSSNPFTVPLGDNVSSTWDAYLSTASGDWTQSSVLDTTVATGRATGNCRPPNGRVEVCNRAYGNNGWLGLAQIWVSGVHIAKGAVKLNDTYFNVSPYNTPPWRRLVMCQEIGHTFGLDHQDENFGNANLGTCMDYTGDPDGPPSNEHPNVHDYEQLEAIYAHLDALSALRAHGASAPTVADDDFSEPGQWGKIVRVSPDGRTSLHERDLGNGHKVFTFVTWAEEGRGK